MEETQINIFRLKSWHKWSLAGILALALFFRFYQISTMPGGLFPDEAANGLDINLIQQGNTQPFFERGNGREALFFYILDVSVEAFGRGPWQHHGVSALIGLLSVLVCFLVTKSLLMLVAKTDEEKERAVQIALLAAFFMATSSWHITLSRTAFRAILIPLFTALATWASANIILTSTKAKRYLWSALAGLFFGLGLYTYIAYRMFLIIAAVAILFPLLVELFSERFENFKKFIGPILICGVIFGITIVPLAKYFYDHPGSFVGRSGQVSVFNPELNAGHPYIAVAEVSKLSLLAFFSEGDLNWRHNVSGEPFLSPLFSIFFAFGLLLSLILATRYFLKPNLNQKLYPYFLLSGWFVGMLIPVITTAEGIPHGLRSIGVIPSVFIISAIGSFWVADKILELTRFRDEHRSEIAIKVLRFAGITLVSVWLTAISLYSYTLYFVKAANSPENFYSFRSDLTEVSKWLNTESKNGSGNKDNTYLILDKFSVQTVEYETTFDAKHPWDPHNQPYTQVDPEDSWKLADLKTGDRIVFTQSSLFDIKKFLQYHKTATLNLEVRNKFSQTIMAVYIIN